MAEQNEFESFIDKVDTYHKAIEEEFELLKLTDEPSAVRKLVDAKIAGALPGLVEELIKIAHYSDNDSARINAIKFTFGFYFGGSSPMDDPLNKMIEALTNESNQ